MNLVCQRSRSELFISVAEYSVYILVWFEQVKQTSESGYRMSCYCQVWYYMLPLVRVSNFGKMSVLGNFDKTSLSPGLD